MGSRRLLLLAAALALATASAAGCWDRTQIEDLAYVLTLGVDQVEDGELVVTAQVAMVQSLSIGVLGAQIRRDEPVMAARLLTARADNITQALQILSGSMTRRLDLRHLRAVVVGDSLSRQGLEPLVMELLRSGFARGTAALFQARGRAGDMMAAFSPVGEVNPGRATEGLLLVARYLHLTPPSRLHQFAVRMAAPGGDPFVTVAALGTGSGPGPARNSALPGELPRAGGNPVEFGGSAVYRRDRLAGYLTIDQTQCLLALRGEMGKAYSSFPDPDVPDRRVTLRFHQENLPQYRADLRGGRPRLQVRLLLEGEVLAIPGGTDYVRPQARKRPEQAAAQHFTATARDLLRQLREWEADPMGFGHLFRGRFPTWRDWEAYNWRQRLADLEVDLEVTMRIRRYGLLTGPDRAGR